MTPEEMRETELTLIQLFIHLLIFLYIIHWYHDLYMASQVTDSILGKLIPSYSYW